MTLKKLWVDDEKAHPDGWERAYTYAEAEALLRANDYDVVALDHDLGHGGTGYDLMVGLWESGEASVPGSLDIISFNPAGVKRMVALAERLGLRHSVHWFTATQLERELENGGSLNITEQP